MSVRRLPWILAACLAACLSWARPALAGPRNDVQKRLTAAMESYDLLEYEAARKLLLSALELAKEGRLEGDPLVARVHVSLGIVYFAGLQDKAAARRAFADAVATDPDVALDPAYKTPEMSALLESVRAQTAPSKDPPRDDRGRGTDARGDAPEFDCFTISGLKHHLVDSAPRGRALRVTAWLGGDIQAARVSVFYRAVRAAEFQEVRLVRDRDCSYAGSIPANAVTGELLYYYVAALNKAGLVVASSGAAGAPNLIQIVDRGGADVGPARDQDPVDEPPARDERAGRDEVDGRGRQDVRRDEGGDGELRRDAGAAVRVEEPAPGRSGKRARKLSVALGATTGVGYVTGETEQLRNEVKCCIAPGWFTLSGEVTYALSSRLALGGAVRLGFPIGANIDGHSPLGPSAFARLRYALASTPSSFYLAGQLGGGFIRNTLKLSDTMDPAMDTDVVALGPLLAGGSFGYLAALGRSFQLHLDLSAIVGVPVVSELGTSRLNFGVQLDATVGIGVLF